MGDVMKTYDELYDDIKRAVDAGFESGYLNEPYDVTDWKGYINYGAFHAYRYVLDRLEEIREAEERHTKSELRVDILLDTIENLERTLSELQSQSSELYLTLCEMELRAKKEGSNEWV